MRSIPWLVPAAVAGLLVAACGGGDDSAEVAAGDRPTIVVTTGILGDVVSSLVGDAAEVTTIMPPGASPHEFQASAQQAQAMREADLLIANGAGFEEGLLDVIEGAEDDGVPVYEAISAVETVEFADEHGHEGEEAEEDHAAEEAEEEGEDHAEEAEEDHAAEEVEDEGEDHEHSGVDPHFFTDPARMAVAAQSILDELLDQVSALDTDEVRSRAEDYISELEALDTEIEGTLDVVAEADRILVTNHDVFGYFADRYGFEVVGTVIPADTTTAEPSAGDLADLARVIEAEGARAIFADTSSPEQLAETLAAEVGDVEVVELYSESLGEPGSGAETYVEMVRTNAERIATALT
jgi:zinc/manganese transport system substrate-binding protein